MRDIYQRDGFYSPLNLFNIDKAKIYRKYLEDAENKIGPLHYFTKTYTLMKWVYEIATNSILLNSVEELIGKNILLYNATFIIKEPRTKTHVSWHQDLTYWGFDDNEKQVSAWIALSNANEVSGCMQMIPGSHLEGMRDQETADDPDNVLLQSQTITNVDDRLAVICELEPGEVSLHHGWTVHCSRPNLSNDRRIGLNAQYIRPSMRQTKSDHDSAMLVRGTDKFGYYRQDLAAQSWLEKNAAQQLTIASEEYQEIAGRANPS
mgnify:CR=1 FL=1